MKQELKKFGEITLSRKLLQAIQAMGFEEPSPVQAQTIPLALAGKVVLKGKNPLEPETRLIDLARPLVTIPNLAIHMNRKVNEGIAIKKQKDILPLAAVLNNGTAILTWVMASVSEWVAALPFSSFSVTPWSLPKCALWYVVWGFVLLGVGALLPRRGQESKKWWR